MEQEASEVFCSPFLRCVPPHMFPQRLDGSTTPDPHICPLSPPAPLSPAAQGVKHESAPAVEPKEEDPAAQERPAEAAPAGAPAEPGDGDHVPPSQAGEPPRKRHHLLRHELTKEAQEAAAAHFGADTAVEAAHIVWTLK